MPNHLDLPGPIRSPTRRAGGGGGGPPVRNSPRDHARELTQGLEANPGRAPEIDEIDPELVFKFNAATRLPGNALESQGIEILGEDDNWTYFVLLDEPARQHFADALRSFGRSDSEPTSEISAGLRRAIQSIDGIELYGPDDRISPDLEPPRPGETVEAHVRLWPAGSRVEGEARVDRVAQVISSSAGCQVLASTSRPQTAAVVASVTAPGLTLLSELSVVEKITPPMFVAVSSTDIETADVGDGHIPRGAPIGILDDGPTLVNPIIAAVLAGTESFPGPASYSWNPPGAHGVAVASIAAYYDFESQVGNGDALRDPHPIYVARVMEPGPPGAGQATTTRQPRGTIFHESVEEAIRWLHSSGVRVMNMSINANIPAQAGAPRDELTFVLDGLARELDIVIVLSAGNSALEVLGNHMFGRHVAHDYPSYLMDPEVGIAEPGLSANCLTVGGEARSSTSAFPGYKGIAPPGCTSPFSRTGVNAGKGRFKPDVVHWAGNWTWNDRLDVYAPNDPATSVIVASNQPGQALDWTCGTSFAAPRVAHIAADVLTQYPGSSANLVRALILLSSRPSAAMKSLMPDRSARQSATGAGQPDPELAVSSGGNRVILTYEGEIECDTSVIHPVPIPPEFARGRRRRRIRVAVVCDPPVRRTRREYVAGHLSVAMLRAMDQDEVLKVFQRQPSAKARKSDTSLIAVPLPRNRRRLKLSPGPDDVARSTAYVSEFTTLQLNEDDGDTYYIAMTHQKSPWQNLDDYDLQRYALAIELIDEGETEINLYQLVRNRIQARARVRTS